MLDAGCWILDAGYWMLDTGYSILDARYLMLDSGGTGLMVLGAQGMEHF